MIKKQSLRLLLSVIWCLILSNKTSAQVVINEFLPDPPDPNDQSEWIELYNFSNEAVDLQGWQIDDQEGGSKPFTLDGIIISANGYIVIEKITSNIALNNSSDQVQLFDASGKRVDAIDYKSIPESYSYARIPDGGEWQIVEYPTKNSQNQSPHEKPVPFEAPTLPPQVIIIISEIVSCPSPNQSEWIELYNPNQFQVDLLNWKIVDDANNKVILEGIMGPKKHHVISIKKPILNNSGDTITLENPSGKAIDQATTIQCTQEGISFIIESGQWQETITTTPNTSNQYVPLPKPTLKPETTQKKIVEPTISPVYSVTPLLSKTIRLPVDTNSSSLSSTPINYIATVAGIINVSSKSAVASASTEMEISPKTAPKPWLLISGMLVTSLGFIPRKLKKNGYK